MYTRSHSGFTDNSEPAVQRLLSMLSALRNFYDVKGSFHYSVVPASELELKAHVHIKILNSNFLILMCFLFWKFENVNLDRMV